MAEHNKVAIALPHKWYSNPNIFGEAPLTLTPLTVPDYLHCQYGVSYINHTICKDSALHGNIMVRCYKVQCVSLA